MRTPWKAITAALPVCLAVAYLSLGDPLGDLLRLSMAGTNSPIVRQVRSQLVQQPSNSSRYSSQYNPSSGIYAQRMNQNVLRSFRESIADNWMSTVRVLSNGRQVAMGTVVAADGWIVTKASELGIPRGDADPEIDLQVRLYDQSRESATVVARRDDIDVALLRIDRSDLIPAKFTDSSSLRVGSWLATSDLRPVPSSVGIVSVLPRAVRQERAVLGIGFDWVNNSNEVQTVIPGSGADRAGMRIGDIVDSINGINLPRRESLLEAIRLHKAGDELVIGIRRGEKARTVSAQLMDLNSTLLDPTEMEVNGRISARSSGFNSVFQHDTVLMPNQCGGPLVNLQGKVVGINIARSGRVCSYALPTNILSAAVTEMMATSGGGTLATIITSDPQTITAAKPVVSSPQPANGY
jgi:serine protease Do